MKVSRYVQKSNHVDALEWTGTQACLELLRSKLPTARPAYVNCAFVPIGNTFDVAEVGDFIILYPYTKVVKLDEFNDNYEICNL